MSDPMDCSTPGFSVHYQLLGLAQTHVHRVGDAIQTSHPLLFPSPDFNLFQHQGLFQWVGSSYQVAKVWELQHQSLQWIFRTDFLKEWLVWSPCSPRDSQESSLTPKASIFWHSAFFRFQLFMKFVYLFEFILGCKVVEMRRPERKTETQRVAEEGIWV